MPKRGRGRRADVARAGLDKIQRRQVRRVADLEAIFEGIETMPAVIVGRGIGGMSALT